MAEVYKTVTFEKKVFNNLKFHIQNYGIEFSVELLMEKHLKITVSKLIINFQKTSDATINNNNNNKVLFHNHLHIYIYIYIYIYTSGVPDFVGFE